MRSWVVLKWWIPPLATLAAVAATANCMDNLPAATGCIPLSQTDEGCLPLSETQCLAGPRTTVECQGTGAECPIADAGTGCPQAVIDRFGQGVECPNLTLADFAAFGEKSSAQCLTGCLTCARVCDGVGPVLGVRTGESFKSDVPPPGMPDFILLPIELHMPETGLLGLYVRVRGEGTFQVAFLHGPLLGGDDVTGGDMFSSYGEDFQDLMLPLDPELAFEWDATTRPDYLVIKGIQTLIEIDCVVPFVLP